MRPLPPIIFAVSLGFLTEAFIASIMVVSGMVEVLGKSVGPCDSLPPDLLVLVLLHYPGLVLADHLRISEPTAFWLAAFVSAILWSAVWYFALKIFVKRKPAA
jgi:hypothetical protein